MKLTVQGVRMIANCQNTVIRRQTNGLPPGLPDQAYAVWCGNLTQLHRSESPIQAEQFYQACSDCLQTLQAGQLLDKKNARWLKAQLVEIRNNVCKALKQSQR